MKRILPLLFVLTQTVLVFAQNVEWREMVVGPSESVWASSSLTETVGGRSVAYGPEALFDGDRTSPWVEGAEGSGLGESVTVLTNRVITGLTVVNGFARSRLLFSRNNRVKRISLVFVAGMTAPGMVSEQDCTLYFVQEGAAREYELKDSMEPQSLDLRPFEELQKNLYLEVLRSFSLEYPDLFAKALDDLGISQSEWKEPMNLELIRAVYGFFALKIILVDVYKGTHYDDTCVSELVFALEDF